MFSKDSLHEFLLDKCGEYKQELFEFESPEKFHVVIKCKPGEHNENYSGFCKTFIKHFSSFTNTNWIVRSTFPKLIRLAFRKIFTCQHSSFNKNSKARTNRTRSRGCDATIDIKVKKVNRNTCRYDPDLKEGYTVLLKINYSHTHSTNVAEAYSHLRSAEETDDCFRKYFDSGMSPAAAISFHDMFLIEKYGKECSAYLANSQFNPSERHVYYLYEKWRKLNCDRSDLNVDEVLERKLSELEEKDLTNESGKNPNIGDDMVIKEEFDVIEDSDEPIEVTTDICITAEQTPANLKCSVADDTVIPNTYNEALTEMKEGFNKLTSILEKHPSSSNLKAIHIFNNSLKNITTEQQVLNFLNNFKKGLSRKIRVQSTSVSRRITKKQRTKKEYEQADPQFQHLRGKIIRKKKHDLAFNI